MDIDAYDVPFRHHSVFFPRNNKSVTEEDLSLLLCSDYFPVKGTGRGIVTLVWLSRTK